MMNRTMLARQFLGDDSIAVELGVACGMYSHAILEHTPVKKLYSIDRWAGDRQHTSEEMAAAARNLDEFGRRSIIIKAYFYDALELFPDNSIDFLYIDGYAHTGQEEGETLSQWYNKVKPGGVFAGHDYHPRWPETIHYVQNFFYMLAAVNDRDGEFKVTDETLPEFPSWYHIKGESNE